MGTRMRMRMRGILGMWRVGVMDYTVLGFEGDGGRGGELEEDGGLYLLE